MQSRKVTPFIFLAAEISITFIVYTLLFPEIFFGRNFSFLRFQDTEFEFLGSRLASDFFLNKSFPLWNWWDSSNFGFSFLSGALNYPSIFTGALFAAIKSFSPGSININSFYDLHKFSYILLPLLVRSYGMMKLSRAMNISIPVAIFSGVWLSIFIGYTSLLGLTIATVFSFLPLLFYYVLSFYRSHSFVYIGKTLLVFLFVALCYPLVFFGYFLQVVHLSLWSFIIWQIFRGGVIVKTKILIVVILGSDTKIKLALGCCFFSIFLFLTFMYDQEFSKLDFGVNSRISRINPFSYFFSPHMGADVKYFPGISLVSSKPMWTSQFQFLGIVFLLFTVVGLVKARSSLKWPLFALILLLLGIQFPRNEIGFGLIPHSLTAFSNPFSFLLRSAHMSGAFSIPYLLIPFFMVGAQFFFKPSNFSKFNPRDKLFSLLIISGLCSSTFILFYSIREFSIISISLTVVSCFFVFFGLWYFFFSVSQGNVKKFFFVLILIFFDLFSLSSYVEPVTRAMAPNLSYVEGINRQIIPDFINPTVKKTPLIQFRDRTGCVNSYIACDPINAQGYLLGFNDIGKYSDKGNEYKPRHESFVSLGEPGSEASDFLQNSNDFLICLLDTSTSDPENFCDEIESSWNQVFVTAPEFPHLRNSNFDTYSIYLGNTESIQNRSSSNYYRSIPNVQVIVNDSPLSPVDGFLYDSYQFDLSNIKEDYLYFTLPANEKIVDVNLYVSTFKSFDPFTFVSTGNSLLFSLDLPESKDSVLKIPYDKDFRIFINGKVAEFNKSFGSFIGLELNGGVSQVEIVYNPDSRLHIYYLLSWLSLFVLFVSLIPSLRMNYLLKSNL